MSEIDVLHFTTCVGGGVPQVILDHVRAVPDVRHGIVWPSENHALAVEELRSRPGLLLSDPATYRGFRAALKRHRPRLVVAHSSWAGVLARVLPTEAPVIYQPHCPAYDNTAFGTTSRGFFRLSERILARHAAVLVATCDSEADGLRGIAGQVPVVVVPNTSRVTPADMGTGGERRTAREVVAVGRLAAQKDPEYFADVARRVARDVPSAQFTWIGDGDRGLRDVLEQAGVEVTGWLKHDEVTRRMSRADLYVHTACFEGFPLTLLDALALGLPVLVRDLANFSELPLMKSASSIQMARQVIEALSDSARLDQLGDLSRTVGSGFSSERQRQRLLELYAQTSGRWSAAQDHVPAASSQGRRHDQKGWLPS